MKNPGKLISVQSTIKTYRSEVKESYFILILAIIMEHIIKNSNDKEKLKQFFDIFDHLLIIFIPQYSIQ